MTEESSHQSYIYRFIKYKKNIDFYIIIKFYINKYAYISVILSIFMSILTYYNMQIMSRNIDTFLLKIINIFYSEISNDAKLMCMWVFVFLSYMLILTLNLLIINFFKLAENSIKEEVKNICISSYIAKDTDINYLINSVTISATNFIKSAFKVFMMTLCMIIPIIIMLFNEKLIGIILAVSTVLYIIFCYFITKIIAKKSINVQNISQNSYQMLSDLDGLSDIMVRNNNIDTLNKECSIFENIRINSDISFENMFLWITFFVSVFVAIDFSIASILCDPKKAMCILGITYPIFRLAFDLNEMMRELLNFISYLTKINKGIIAKAEGEERIEKIERIEIKELSDRKGKREVFKNYTQEIDINKEIILIEGPSGSGKSSLMEIITLVRTPSNIEEDEYIKSGLYINGISGDNIKKESYNDLILYIKQKHPVIKYISIKTLFKIMSPGISIHEIHEYLKIVSLDDRIKDLNITPEGFSGGENQRLFIALNLSILRVKNAQIIFLDEITSSLSENQSEMILNNIITLAKEHGFIIFFITHQESLKSSSFFTISLSDPFQGIGD